MIKAEDMGDFYRIPADTRDLNYEQFFSEGKDISEVKDYHSHNTERLNVEQTKSILLKLEISRKDLNL